MTLQATFITIHPSFIESYFSFGVFSHAQKKNLAKFQALNLRDFSVDKHGSIDASPYGGGESMIFRPEPLADAVKALGRDGQEGKDLHVILPSPAGKKWTQDDAYRLKTLDKHLVFVCGRFGGVDKRFIDHYVDEEISLGDFVISGGELASLTMMDATLRLIPGVLGNEESFVQDSFSEGMDYLLEHSLYTRPPVFEGVPVPEVLMSGDHKKIREWRKKEALERTAKLRPDLLDTSKR